MADQTLLTFSSPAEAVQVRDALRQIVGRSVRPPEEGDVEDSVGEIQFRIGKTDIAVTKGTAAVAVSIWDGATAATLADTGVNEDACCLFASIAAGKWVLLVGFRWSWLIVAAECG